MHAARASTGSIIGITLHTCRTAAAAIDAISERGLMSGLPPTDADAAVSSDESEKASRL
jgi:hypothetical protein